MKTEKWEGNNQVPASVCQFVLADAVSFAEKGKDDKNMVKLTGYRGDIIKHWYWGNLAFDMKGLHFDKPRTPGLIDHNTSKRLTYSTDRAIEPETYLAGPILENDNAQELAKDIKNGFPFQSSLSLDPEIVEQISEGQSVEVNGKILKGPGAVFRKAAILEISAVVFGAFSNTETSEYSEDKTKYNFDLVKENKMSEKKETKLTLEQFKNDNAELFSQIFDSGKTEGAKTEKERFARLQAACGDDHELVVNCFAEGLDTAEAQSKRIEKLSAKNIELAKKLEENNAGKKPAVDPAEQEFSDSGLEPGKETKNFDEKNATDEQLKEHFAQSKELQNEYTCADAYVMAIRHPQRK